MTHPLIKVISSTVYTAITLSALYYILLEAYKIRLYAIEEYGAIIHEFDPYFNFRATEYLYENGWKAFATWFDRLVWYPLGRPVGTTIYPGMQVTAVFLKNWVLKDWSLNDICCYMPAWFGSAATLFTGLLAYECSLGVPGIVGKGGMSKNVGKGAGDPGEFGCILSSIPIIGWIWNRYVSFWWARLITLITGFVGTDLGLMVRSGDRPYGSPAVECGICAAGIMSVVPAHLMRSIGGGYDNESIAMTAMTMTFYLWTRSLRGGPESTSWKFGLLAGLAYFYMVAAWGGYVFVINLIGVHAGILVLMGRYSNKLYKAYSLFFVVGTALATTVPVVGWTPLKSLEQLGPMAVFLGFQLIQIGEVLRIRLKLNRREAWTLRIKLFATAALFAAAIVTLLWPTGYFGPISSRVRGLFVKHTKTGNPLVDSVAEHQPASSEAYHQYLGDICYVAPVGFALVAMLYLHDSSSFLLVYGTASYFFSHKMVRLILLTSPIGSTLSGIVFGRFVGWALGALMDYKPGFGGLWNTFLDGDDHSGDIPPIANSPQQPKPKAKNSSKVKKTKKNKDSNTNGSSPTANSEPSKTNIIRTTFVFLTRLARIVAFVYLLRKEGIPRAEKFHKYAKENAQRMSHPTILFKANTNDGRSITVDDYREAYWWLRDNTPEDARIMAWWDYGYQITAIANRTTIADGNTWNHEHIALLGMALTSSEKEGHRIARHLADYVLVWAGGGGDDIAKSPHLRRIANSVYRGLCPRDPTCRNFGFRQQGVPTKMMGESLLYKLVRGGIDPSIEIDKNRFRHVHTSRYGKVRIYKIQSVSKESKMWVANPDNQLCDAPGSWFCPGQYPPGLNKVLKQKQDFNQLEDFNKGTGKDEEYQKQYMENLNNPELAKRRSQQQQKEQTHQKLDIPQHKIDSLQHAEAWKDTEVTSALWQMIHDGAYQELKEFLDESPLVAHTRASDGRGPMWWAHEFKMNKIAKLLKVRYGVKDDLRDKDGITPLNLG